MNSYQIDCIKNIGEDSINFVCFVQAPDESSIKSFFQEQGIIVLSQNIVQPPVSLFVVTCPETTVTILIENEDEARYLLVDMSIRRSDIIDITTRQSVTTIKSSITSYQQTITQQRKQSQQAAKEREEVNKKQFIDSRLETIRESMNIIVAEQEKVTSYSATILSSNEQKALYESIDEIKKVRMGTNIDKMINACDTFFRLWEKAILDPSSGKASEKILFHSIITEHDIRIAAMGYEKAQVVSKSFTPQSASDRIYRSLGSMGVYRRLLHKEFTQKQGNTNRVTTVLTATQTILVIFGICLGLYMMILSLLGLTVNPLLYIIFLYYGTIGLSRTVASIIRVNDIQTLFIRLCFFGCFLGGSLYLLINNFGL